MRKRLVIRPRNMKNKLAIQDLEIVESDPNESLALSDDQW